MKIDIRKACEGLSDEEARKVVTKVADNLIEAQLDLRTAKELEDLRAMREASRIR